MGNILRQERSEVTFESITLKHYTVGH